MLTRYIVTYDIADPKRLHRVFRALRRYGDHLQLSVFECRLTETAHLRLCDKLRQTIVASEDQVLFIRLGPANSSRQDDTIAALGLPYAIRDQSVTVL